LLFNRLKNKKAINQADEIFTCAIKINCSTVFSLFLHEKRATDRLYKRNSLTACRQYGLMRPVARIAQSVEQGIENPRVLGSIPSPGTTI
jgi:hypothetical protein